VAVSDAFADGFDNAGNPANVPGFTPMASECSCNSFAKITCSLLCGVCCLLSSVCCLLSAFGVREFVMRGDTVDGIDHDVTTMTTRKSAIWTIFSHRNIIV
jgi:hypothetical protein